MWLSDRQTKSLLRVQYQQDRSQPGRKKSGAPIKKEGSQKYRGVQEKIAAYATCSLYQVHDLEANPYQHCGQTIADEPLLGLCRKPIQNSFHMNPQNV